LTDEFSARFALGRVPLPSARSLAFSQASQRSVDRRRCWPSARTSGRRRYRRPALGSGDRQTFLLLVEQFMQSRFVVIFEFIRFEMTGLLLDDMVGQMVTLTSLISSKYSPASRTS
jgi:hypothetical protein